MDSPQWKEEKEILPVDEFEQRLLLAKKYQSFIRTQLEEGAKPNDEEAKKTAKAWKLSRLDYVALMVMPLDELVKVTNNDVEMDQLSSRLKPLVEAVRFLLKSEAQCDKMPTVGSSNKRGPGKHGGKGKAAKPGSGSSVVLESATDEDDMNNDKDDGANDQGGLNNHTNKAHRKQRERAVCWSADGGKCQISGSEQPVVCHIIPYCWNNKPHNLQKSAMIQYSFDLFKIPFTANLYICGKGLQGSDIAANMICLNPSLHQLWNKGFCGIKYLGNNGPTSAGQTEIKLQMIRMPKVKQEGFLAQDRIDLDEERDPTRSFICKLRSLTKDATRCQTFGEGLPIFSGMTFTIQRRIDYVVLVTALIRLRWYLGLVAAMAGAAGDDDFIYGQDDDFERDIRRAVKIEKQLRQEREAEEEELRQQKRTRDWVASQELQDGDSSKGL